MILACSFRSRKEVEIEMLIQFDYNLGFLFHFIIDPSTPTVISFLFLTKYKHPGKIPAIFEFQMTSSVYSHNNSISWIAAFSLFLICASFFGCYGVLSLLFTSLVLMLSTFLSPFSKKKGHVLVEKLEQIGAIISSEENRALKVEEVISESQPETETVSQNKQETQEENGADEINGPADLYSESESIDHSSTTGDSDIGWPYSGDLSDGSISDEESLIEIAIPSGQYVSPKEEEKYPKLCLPSQVKLPSFSPEEIFGQHGGLMELLPEYNEEENLIEIDLSVGSIKCSRFEMKA